MQTTSTATKVTCFPETASERSRLFAHFMKRIEGPRHAKTGAHNAEARWQRTRANVLLWNTVFPTTALAEPADPFEEALELYGKPENLTQPASVAFRTASDKGGASVPVSGKRNSRSNLAGTTPPIPADLRLALPETPQISFSTTMTPSQSQQQGFDKLKSLRVWALTGVVGSGKTKLALDLLVNLYCHGIIDHVLVISPDGVDAQWIEDAMPDHVHKSIKWKGLHFQKGSKRRAVQFQRFLRPFKGLKVFAINFESVNTKIGIRRIEDFLRGVKDRKLAIVIDESHRLKNPDATTYQNIEDFIFLSRVRGILTGTPYAKDPTDIWAQYKLLDQRIIGYKYKTAFKGQYCVLGGGINGFGVTKAKNEEQLFASYDPVTHRVDDGELGLQKPTFKTYTFEMTPAQKKIYQEMQANLLLEYEGHKMNAANGGVALMRLQQISCGFFVNDDGEIIDIDNPRADALESVLCQLQNVKVIIWARFRKDIENVMAMLGDNALDYYGATSKADKEKTKREFMKRDSIQYLVANAASLGTGTDGMQKVCNHSVYYSNSFSGIERWQSQGRTQRKGMENPSRFVDLVCRGSKDRKILRVLKQRKSVSDLLLDDIRKMFHEDD